MLEAELSGDIAAGSYKVRSRGLEKPVLEGELPGDIAAVGYKSKGYRSRCLEKTVLEAELSRGG